MKGKELLERSRTEVRKDRKRRQDKMILDMLHDITRRYKKAMNEQEQQQQQTLQWIPVSERLPEEWTDVLVWSKCGFCEVAVYLGIPGKWRESWTHMMIDDDTVTHWMPLPEPPKEDEK